MLGSIRTATKSWASKAVIIVVALSFGVWGISDVFSGGSRDAVAVVGDAAVSTVEFQRAFRREVQRLQARFPDLTNERAHEMGVSGQVLGRLIRRTLLDAEAHTLGLRTADELVRETILAQDAFFDEAGNFDRERYRLTLQRNGLTIEDYEDLIRGDLGRAQLLETISAERPAPQALANAIHGYRAERRSADVVRVPREVVTGVAEPTEADLVAFHESNQHRFTAPEYRVATIVHMTAESILSEMSVGETVLRADYEARKSEFSVPERRAIKQVLSSDEGLIREGANMLDAGTSFAEMSEALSARGATALTLGGVEREGLPGSAGDVVFGMAVGEVSAPVQTPLGWHLFMLEEVVPAHTQSFEAVRGQIEQEIALDLAIDSLYELSAQFEDALAGGASLEAAGSAIGTPAVTLDGVDGNGLDRAGGLALSDVAAREEIVSLIFETEEGTTSQLAELRDGSFAMVRTDRIEPSALRPLETVREAVREAWLNQERGAGAETLARAIAERVEAGAALGAAAQEAGLTVTSLENMQRDGRNSGPAGSLQLLEAIFSKSEGDAAPIVAPTPEGWIVAILTDVTEIGASDDRSGTDSIRTEMTRGRSADIAETYQRALFGRHSVAVNTQVLNSLFETP